MLYPSINEIRKKADSRYTLVILAAKRARDIIDGKPVYTEAERITLCPADGHYGCQIPQGAWHTVEVHEPSVIFEAKDGAYKG